MTGPAQGRGRLFGVIAVALLLAAGWNVLGAVRAQTVCLVTSVDGCLDARLTGRADARVSSIDTQDGRGIWYVEFEQAGTTVQGAVVNWPASPAVPGNGPRLGQTVTVAFDPAAPSEHVTDAAALERALADVAADPDPAVRRWEVAAVLALAAVGLGVLARRRPAPGPEAGG